MGALKELFKQPYWVIGLVLGVLLIVVPSVTVDKDNHFATHPPSAILLVAVGIARLLISASGFAFTLWTKYVSDKNTSGGLDLTRVKETDGIVSTTVGACEVRVVEGRLEKYVSEAGTAVILPCNEYFDDKCAGDTKSALGAYVNQVFQGQVDQFISLVKDECVRKFGPGRMQQKTHEEAAQSFGVGKCLLLSKPLGRSSPVALISTTTQRAGEGLAARISYLFEGMRELVAALADARVNEVVMPILGAGHGRIDTPLAFVGLLLAVAEVAHYGQGGQRLTKVTVVIFKRDAITPAQVDQFVVRRALALIGG